MVGKHYIPDTGHVVWVDFDPTKGHEQKKRRPALVLSSEIFNSKTNMMFVCPVTSSKKNYPFEVSLKTKKVSGAILADQLRTLDWTVRNVEYIATASPSVVKAVKENITTILEL